MITAGSTSARQAEKGQIVFVAIATAGLVLLFIEPLYRLARFACSSDLYSYVLLIPFISAYLAWSRPRAPKISTAPVRWAAIVLAIAGLVTIAVFWKLTKLSERLVPDDSLSLTTLSFILLFFSVCVWSLPVGTLREFLFPIGLLIFLVPIPVFIRTWMEGSLQHWSALAAVGIFDLTKTPVFNVGNTLQLADIKLQVAPECSGIHSSIALFITSLIAGHFFLKSNWKRSLLALAVIPLGILRNGFRIFTIGELCVHVGPEMIDSKIHRKGGPVFFVLSLVPLLILLYFLLKSEQHPKAPESRAL